MELQIVFVLKENEHENKEGRMKTVNESVWKSRQENRLCFRKKDLEMRKFLSNRREAMTN